MRKVLAALFAVLLLPSIAGAEIFTISPGPPTTLPGGGTQNFTTANLAHWNACLGRVITRQTGGPRTDNRCRVVILGDSAITGWGAGALFNDGAGHISPITGGPDFNQAAYMQKILNSYAPTSYNSWFSDSNMLGFDNNNYGNYNTHVTLGAGWGTLLQTVGGYNIGCSGCSTVLSFTPPYPFDTIVVFYGTDPGAGLGAAMPINVDGGANLGTINQTTTASATSSSFTTTRGNHTINITGTGNNHTVSGILAYDSTQPAVDIIVVGQTGGTACTVVNTYPANMVVTFTASPNITYAEPFRGQITLAAAMPVQFQTTGTLPSPLVPATTYYIISTGLSTTNFQVAATLGGTAITMSGAGTGTQRVVPGCYPTPPGYAYDPMASLKSIQPDLTIIGVGGNDMSQSLLVSAQATNPSNPLGWYQQNMQTIITAAQVSGDFILFSPMPANAVQVTNGVADQYIAIMRSLSAANNGLYIDQFRRWGFPFAPVNALGYFYSDGFHPSVFGYAASARALLEPLAAVPASVFVGGMLPNSFTGTAAGYAANGQAYYQGSVFTGTSSAVISTASETTAFPAIGVGHQSLPANSVTVGTKFRINGRGRFSTPAANAATLVPRLKYNSAAPVTISTVTTAALPSSVTNAPIVFDFQCTVRTTGVTGSIFCAGGVTYDTANPGLPGALTYNDMTNTAAQTIDTTQSAALDVTFTWSTVAGGQTMTVDQASIEVIN